MIESGACSMGAESSYGVLMERFMAAVEEDYADTDFLVRSFCIFIRCHLYEPTCQVRARLAATVSLRPSLRSQPVDRSSRPAPAHLNVSQRRDRFSQSLWDLQQELCRVNDAAGLCGGCQRGVRGDADVSQRGPGSSGHRAEGGRVDAGEQNLCAGLYVLRWAYTCSPLPWILPAHSGDMATGCRWHLDGARLQKRSLWQLNTCNTIDMQAQYLRLNADFENFRRRAATEKDATSTRVKAKTVEVRTMSQASTDGDACRLP